MGIGDKRVYLFDSFKVDLRTGSLYRDRERINLGPKPFDTLAYLLENRGRLVSKQELIKQIWSDCFVTDDVLVQSIVDIRRALGDDARHPRYIQTLPKRGYIFIAEAKAIDIGGGRAAGEPDRAESGNGTAGRTAGANSATDAEAEQGRPAGGVAGLFRASGWRSIFLIAGALTLVAALLYFARLDRKGILAPGSNSAATVEPGSMAVMPFEVQSDAPGYEWLGRGLAEMFSTALSQSPELRIISHRRLLLAGAGEKESSPLFESRALEVARRARAERMITGSFIKLGKNFQINAHLVNVADGSQTASFRARGQISEDIFNAVDELCYKIRQTLVLEEEPHAFHRRQIEEVTTRSLEAYRHYVAALDKYLRGGRSGAEMAQSELEEAVRIDPSFAMAYFKLAEVRQWASAWGYSDASPRESLMQALKYSSDLPEKERLLISGMKALAVDGDADAALATWQRLERIYPTYAVEAGVPIMISGIYMERGQLGALIRYGERYIDDPNMRPDDKARLSSYLATAFRRKGDLSKAIIYAEKCIELWPVKDSPVFIFHLINLGRNYLDAGRRDEALASFRRARAAAAGDAPNLTDAAWGFYMAGEIDEALELVEQALGVERKYGNAYHLRGWINLSQGKFEQAAADFERAYAQTPPQFGSAFHGIIGGDLPALYYAGVACEKLGNRQRAEAIFRKLIKLCRAARRGRTGKDKSTIGYVQTYTLEALALGRLGFKQECESLIEQMPMGGDYYPALCQQLARIHAVLGNQATALEWLGRAIAAGAGEHQHIRDNPDFESLHDLQPFQQLVGSRRKA